MKQSQNLRVMPTCKRATWAVIRVLCLAAPLCSLALQTEARAQTIPRSEDVLPVAAVVRQQLSLQEANPEELLAGAMSQFHYFFPAGVATQVTGRAQLDALLAATVLLEEGMRRGSISYDHAFVLFQCYAIMYASGRSGTLERTFRQMREAGTQMSDEEQEMVDLYMQTLEAFEDHGRRSVEQLGRLLLEVRPDRTEVAYTLASIAEEEGDLDEAAGLYRLGIDAERYPERLLALGELQSLAGGDGAEASLATATRLESELDDEAERVRDRVPQRRRAFELRRRVESGRASEAERYELAGLLRELGRVVDAIELYESLEDWDSAPPEYAEEYAMVAMEANLPGVMERVLDITRDRPAPSPRLLQLRLAAESLGVIRTAATATEAFELDAYLTGEAGSQLAQDLEAYRAVNPGGADFVRTYLELIASLVELRRAGQVDEANVDALARSIGQLREHQPDNHSAYRFQIMLALYRDDLEGLTRALDDYGTFCASHDCAPNYRRTAALVLLQAAVSQNELELLDQVDAILDAWPRGQQWALHELVRGTLALVRSKLGRGSASEREGLAGEAREALRSAARLQGEPGQRPIATGLDYAALFNNLAVLAIDARDMPAAKLYLEGARRFDPTHPVALLNLGVALANGRNFIDAFVTFGLGASEAMTDPALSFQLMRWAGHVYALTDRSNESAEAYRRALRLYESGDDWTALVDDGVYPGGPVEWGLLYLEDEGLVVTLDLTSPPMFFVPAPVSVLEMSGAVEP